MGQSIRDLCVVGVWYPEKEMSGMVVKSDSVSLSQRPRTLLRIDMGSRLPQ